MENRFNEVEREKNALKTKLLTAEVEQEMKDKCISKINKQHRAEVGEVNVTLYNFKSRLNFPGNIWICRYDYQASRLLNENHALTKQVRDLGANVFALESELSVSLQERDKLVALHLNDQV